MMETKRKEPLISADYNTRISLSGDAKFLKEFQQLEMEDDDIYNCYAPAIVFTERDTDIPDEIMQKITEMHGINCEGSGIPGPLCGGCYWSYN